MPINAMIVMLIGTSTAGKSSICKALEQGPNLWSVDGGDMAMERGFAQAEKYFFSLIEKKEEDLAAFRELQQTFPKRDIYRAILNEKISIQGESVSFMDESNHPKLTDKDALNLRSLTKSIQDKVKQYHFLTAKELQKDIFDRAIVNSKKGIPTVFDLIPEDLDIAEFKDYLKQKGHVCPTHIALIHCPLDTLAQRMLMRNESARKRNDPTDIREGLFPFDQYCEAFGIIPKKEALSIGTITRQAVNDSVKLFSSDPEDANKLCQKLGFKPGEAEIRLSPKFDYDTLYDTAQWSSEEIARNLNAQMLHHHAVGGPAVGILNSFRQIQSAPKMDSVQPQPSKNKCCVIL